MAGQDWMVKTGAQFEGDLGEILALGAEFRPILVSGRSGSLPKKKLKKTKKNFFFFFFFILSAHHRQALMSV